MRKIFISQVMRGRTREAIIAEREAMINATKEKYGEVIIVDSYFKDYNPQAGCIPLKYLAKSIELLADADIIVMGKGYESARGCVIEHDCAKAYGIAIEYY